MILRARAAAKESKQTLRAKRVPVGGLSFERAGVLSARTLSARRPEGAHLMLRRPIFGGGVAHTALGDAVRVSAV
jgi:hypothetical protein